jgi:hypothetical protein
MKFNANLMWFLAAFYVLVAVGYGVWYANTHAANPTEADLGMFPFPFEPIGTAALAMLAIMAAFLAFYLDKTAKSQGPVPEDRLDANIEDGESEIGFFAPWSWWPFFLGAFAALAFAALAVGWWMFFIAVPLALVAVIGFVFEHSRGHFAH